MYTEKKNRELKKRAETQENVKFHFQAPLMLVQKFRRQIFTLFKFNLLPEPRKLLFQNSCSMAVGLLSSRNNFACKDKEIRNLP